MKKTAEILKDIDFSSLFTIFNKNKYLIFFTTLLFIFIGYLYESQESSVRTFNLTISFEQIGKEDKINFRLLNNALHSLDTMEMENIYLKMISADNDGIGGKNNNTNLDKIITTLLDNNLKTEIDYIPYTDIYQILYSNVNDYNFMPNVSKEYNDSIKKEFGNDPELMNALLIKQKPTYLTRKLDNEGGTRMVLEVFFADEFDSIKARKYAAIIIQNLKVSVNEEVLSIINFYVENYERKREETYILIKKLVNYFSTLPRSKELYNEETLYQFNNFVTLDNVNKIFDHLDLKNGKLPYFKEVDVNNTTNPYIKTEYLDDENLYATFFLGLIGFMVGVFISLINTYRANKNTISN